MEPSPSDVAARVERLERRVAALEAALAVGTLPAPVTASPAWAPADRRATVDAPPSDDVRAPAEPDGLPPLVRSEWLAIPALVGRTFLALAGAYLLRALTDSGALPPKLGVVAGLAYAAIWFVYADRRAPAARVGAEFHGLVGTLVAVPVVWEAATRFQLLTPAGAALALGAIAAAGLAIAAYRRLHVLAWLVALLVAAAAAALVPATDRIVPSALLLIALGVATLWLGYTRHWLALRWPIAGMADLIVVGLTVRVATNHGVERPATALAIQVALIGGYLVSIMVRTLVRGRDVIPFEIVEGILALAVGLGGAAVVAGAATAGTVAVGAAMLLLGGTCYALAFMFVARRQGLRANFYFYTTLGIMLALAGTRLVLDDAALTVALAALAVAAAAVAARTGPRFIVTHAAAYSAAGAIVSGLLFTSTFRLVAPPAIAWPPFDGPMLLAIAAPALCEAMPLPRRAGPWDFWSHPPRLVLLLLAMWGGAGLAIDLAIRATTGAAIDPGALATVRTGVLAAAALGLARLGRAEGFREARWVVYPLLLTGGVKLLMEDLPRSRPSTLFAAFAAYGVALILAPRLYHRQHVPPPRPAASDPR